MSSHNSTSIEDLLLATLDAVSRFRVGQREAVNAALEAGGAADRSQGPAATWGVGRLAWKGRPCVANGANLDEIGRHGPNSRGSH